MLFFRRSIMKLSLLLITTIFTTFSLTSCKSGTKGNPQLQQAKGAETKTQVKESKTNKQENDKKNQKESVKTAPIGDIVFEKMHAVELKNDFSNIDDVKAQLNTFKIKVKLPGALDEDSELSCYKAIEGENVAKAMIPKGSTSSSVEVNIGEKETSTKVYCHVSVSGELTAQIIYNLEKSVLIDSETKLNSLSVSKNNKGYEVDRLILLRNGSLITNDESFTMNVENLYAQDSIIQTFSNAEVTGQRRNTSGRSGGTINLTTKFSTGNLRINMYGQNGDDQTSVPAPITSIPPAGVNAVADSYWEDCYDALVAEANVGRGTCHPIWRFQSAGHPATAGQNGARGTAGFSGNAGGDSGAFNLTTEVANNFEISYDIRPGIGGAGGQGGQGGAGSAGGAPAAAGPSRKGGYPAAPSGSAGGSGDRGINGANGNVFNSCEVNLLAKTKKCAY